MESIVNSMIAHWGMDCGCIAGRVRKAPALPGKENRNNIWPAD